MSTKKERTILAIQNREELRGKLINIKNSWHEEWLTDEGKSIYYQMEKHMDDLIEMLNKDLN